MTNWGKFYRSVTASYTTIRATGFPSSSCSGVYTRCVFRSTARLCIAVVVRVIGVKYGNGAAVASNVHASQAGIELDDFRSTRHRQKCNGRMRIQIEHRHQFISLARQEGAMVFGIECHSMISLTSSDRIPPDDLIDCGINDRKNILVLQIDVHLPRYRVVLRHPCLLSKCKVRTISSFCTSTTASAFPRSSETYSL